MKMAFSFEKDHRNPCTIPPKEPLRKLSGKIVPDNFRQAFDQTREALMQFWRRHSKTHQ
jgi:hypothetical protein